MRLIRTHEIRLKWDGERVSAFIQDAAGDLAGFGADVPAALEDLVQRIRAEGAKVWAPAWAKQYREGGGEGIDVEPFVEGERWEEPTGLCTRSEGGECGVHAISGLEGRMLPLATTWT